MKKALKITGITLGSLVVFQWVVIMDENKR